ncbi:DUF4259 domain-containing protein [Acinetobacter pullicarnis]|uniref:DUF4259 domain-containing protein n=1 Tax=Acinetobacter pullicarnis TaxID=2576829 RepID=UPI0011232893|nr:DUF4259 domain-containing protein [Acinetobacter pullicarnis]
MGAWSHEPFGNDTACDWKSELEGSTDYEVIEQAFDQMIEDDDEYLDADYGSVVHAAAEVLAKVLGQGTQNESYPEGIDEWIATLTSKPSAALLQKAVVALDRLLSEESELNELWEESGEDYPLWKENIATLKEILIAG